MRTQCAIADRRVVPHSLRHTAKQQLQEAGPPDSRISALPGYAGQGQTNGTYGEAATVERRLSGCHFGAFSVATSDLVHLIET